MCWHFSIDIAVLFNEWFVSFAVVKSVRNEERKNDHDWEAEFPAHDEEENDIANDGDEVSEHKSKVVADGGFGLVDITAEPAYKFTWLVLLKEVNIVLDKLGIDVHFHVDGEVFLEILGRNVSKVCGDTESDSYVQEDKDLSIEFLETDWVLVFPHFCDAV